MSENILTNPMDAFPVLPPGRVVSLVPSVTASLFDLGLGGAVVAVTEFCVEPAAKVQSLPKIGGTKNPNVEAIVQLRPDLVIANREENTQAAVEAIAAAGVPVWLAFPRTVREAIDDLYTTAQLFRSDRALERVQVLEQNAELVALTAQGSEPLRYFCPIWQGIDGGTRWWMTFNDDTYPANVLWWFGGANVFGGRQRRYPLRADLGLEPAEDPGTRDGVTRDGVARDVRYPRVTLEEVLSAQPEMILLPDEPFSFNDTHVAEISECFADTPAVRNKKIFRIDGKSITWHGTRLAAALETLPEIFLSDDIAF